MKTALTANHAYAFIHHSAVQLSGRNSSEGREELEVSLCEPDAISLSRKRDDLASPNTSQTLSNHTITCEQLGLISITFVFRNGKNKASASSEPLL